MGADPECQSSSQSPTWPDAEAFRRKGEVRAAQQAYRQMIHAVQSHRLARQLGQTTPLRTQQTRLRRELALFAVAACVLVLVLLVFLAWPQPRYGDLPLADSIIGWLARNELWNLQRNIEADTGDVHKFPFIRLPESKESEESPPEYLLPPGAVVTQRDELLSYWRARTATRPAGDPSDSGPLPPTSHVVMRPPPPPPPKRQTIQLQAKQAVPPGFRAAPFQCSLAPVACKQSSLPTATGPNRGSLWHGWNAVWRSLGSDCAMQANLLDQIGRAVPFRTAEQSLKASFEMRLSECFSEKRQWPEAEEYAQRALCLSEFESLNAYAVLAKSAAERGATEGARRHVQCMVEYAKHYYSRYGQSSAPVYQRINAASQTMYAGAYLWEFAQDYQQAFLLYRQAAEMAKSIHPGNVEDRIRHNELLMNIYSCLQDQYIYTKEESAFLALHQELMLNPAVSPGWGIMFTNQLVMLELRLGRFRDAAQKLDGLIAQYQQVDEYQGNWMFDGTRAWLKREGEQQPALRDVNEQITQLTYAIQGRRKPEKIQQMASVARWLHQH